MANKKGKAPLVKKGSKHPSHPSFKLESSHRTDREADKAQMKLEQEPSVREIRRIVVPKQHILYSKRGRITPKRPKLRR